MTNSSQSTQIPTVNSPGKLLLQLKSIVKGFAGVQALKGVDFDVREGEVHALMGENGAGKSTLMKIMFGVQPPDSGTIEVDGYGAGRRLAEELQHPAKSDTRRDGPEALRLEGVCARGKLRDINLTVCVGEIFGLAGLVGSGRTELVRCIFGADRKDAGTIYVNGKPLDIQRPSDAKAAGIALIPEDRRKQALVPVMDVERNFGLANYGQYAPSGFLRLKQRRKDTERYIEEMAIRPRRAGVRIRNLSGAINRR
jgi:ABC-type sugar transport system ATPase subunit